MNLNHFETFLSVNRLKSFSKASEELLLPQPTVSNRIRQIEEELGKPMFIRNKNNIQLTSFGTIFLQYAQKIHNLYTEAKTMIAQETPPKKVLKIGSSVPFSHPYLKHFIKQIFKDNSKSKINYSTLDHSEICEAILENKLDLGFTLYKNQGIDEMVYQRLDSRDWKVICSENHPFAYKEGIDLLSACKEPLVLLYNHPFYQNLLFSLRNIISIDISISAFMDDVESVKHLVEENIGITFFPSNMINQESTKNSLVEIPIINNPLESIEVYVIYHKDHLVAKNVLQGNY
ncbi:LysR family transcriptional regulator [Robertmurraya massiliosenegalensis]|uniref:LysR family transcriptional regulator n=1 Tax=Robertmurraya TaxID=2837507 RepID=UPI0039A4E75A